MLWELFHKHGLSHRQADVAALVSKGLSNKDVADQLFVTEKTVKFHLTNIYKKMKFKSRAQLIVWCASNLTFEEKVQEMKVAKPAEPDWQMPVGNKIIGNA